MTQVNILRISHGKNKTCSFFGLGQRVQFYSFRRVHTKKKAKDRAYGPCVRQS